MAGSEGRVRWCLSWKGPIGPFSASVPPLAEKWGSDTAFWFVPSELVPFMLSKLLAGFAKGGWNHKGPGKE